MYSMKAAITPIFLCLTVIFIMIIMPSCVPYQKVIKSEFPQGEEHQKNEAVVQHHLKTARVYDQFATLARFDSIWLSDEMRACYVDLYAARRGLSQEEKDALLRRQLEENKHWVSFYLLADIRDVTHISMSEKNTAWTVYLQMTGKPNVQPISIKEVELEPEYQRFFSKNCFNVTKVPYLIKFPALDMQGRRYDEQATLSLVVNSARKYQTMSWDTDMSLIPKTKLKPYEDYYWV